MPEPLSHQQLCLQLFRLPSSLACLRPFLCPFQLSLAFPSQRSSHPRLSPTPLSMDSVALCSSPTHTGFYLICPYNGCEWTPGFRATQAEKATEEGGAGRSAMCVKRETISAIIFDWLPLFENYFQSVVSHCGGRITLNNATGGGGVRGEGG